MGPIHPALVHFPIALTLVSVAVDLYGAATKKPVARIVGFWTLVAATLGANAAVIAGLYDMEKAAGHVDLVHVHMWLGIALLIVLFAATLWRFRLYRRGGGVGPYAVVAPAFALGIIVQGWLGGELVYANGVGVALKSESAPGHDHDTPTAPKVGAGRGLGEGEREGAGHAHDAPATTNREGSAMAGHEDHNAPASAAVSEAQHAPDNTSSPNDDRGHPGHGAPSSPPGGLAVEGRGGASDHGGHAAAASASSATSSRPPSSNASEARNASEASATRTTADTQAASPSLTLPNAPPAAMSISGAQWPAAPTPRRTQRPSNHPASPHAPSAPSYAPPSSLTPVPLLPVDEASSGQSAEPETSAPGHDSLEHAP